MFKIFIGYDPRQIVSYTVLQSSIVRRCSKPVSISPLVLKAMPIERQGLTPFTFSRFLCPWLCDFEGWSLFLDADELVLDDISDLFDLADESKDAMVVKNADPNLHFEMASVILFNNSRCRVLTPKYVETASKLHTIGWTDNVGFLPSEWNHLVGYDDPRHDAKIVHFTQGIPAFPETEDSEYAAAWVSEAQAVVSTQPWQVLMGNSVHAKPVYQRLRHAEEKVSNVG